MKKSLAFIIVVFFSFFLTGCYKEYDRTINVCDEKLFVERYSHSFIDVAYYYLTDSSYFRMYVGKFDNEHGGYSFNCRGDSLEISESDEGKVINIKKYSLVDLRKSKVGF
jgi:hypothetical protein